MEGGEECAMRRDQSLCYNPATVRWFLDYLAEPRLQI